MKKEMSGEYKKMGKLHPAMSQEHVDHFDTHIAHHNPDHNMTELQPHELPKTKRGDGKKMGSLKKTKDMPGHLYEDDKKTLAQE